MRAPRAAREVKEAADPIPKDAISLTEAFNVLVASLPDDSTFWPPLDEDSRQMLANTRSFELNAGHDPEQFDNELQEQYHQQSFANLFLRLALRDGKLVACVRDPKFGHTLRLSRVGWISKDWDDYVPPDVWTNYLGCDDYTHPGPSDSVVHGKLRVVFFLKDDFDRWLDDVFDRPKGLPSSALKGSVRKKLRDLPPLRQAVIEAITAHWPDLQAYRSSDKRDRDEKIDAWLKARKRKAASENTKKRVSSFLNKLDDDECQSLFGPN